MLDGVKTKILIVDDLPEKHLVYKVILEELGQELVFALSGTEALRQVLQNDFAVILLDVNMPDMDGFETAALIRQRKRSAHTPIIFVTAFADELRAAEGYAHGAVDYILAPVVPEILRTKIKVFVELFRMTESVKRQAEEQIILVEERSKRAAAEEANRRLAFLARAGAVLGHSLDYSVTARDVVKLAVPTLADLAVLAQRESGTGNWSVLHAYDRGGEPGLEELTGLEQFPGEWRIAIDQVLSTGDLVSLSSAAEGHGASGPGAIVLPLRARGQTFAALAFSREPSSRWFTAADTTIAEALASRAAIALENARLYKDIEQADRQKNEFLSMLAHELRNPLAPIRNSVAVLRMHRDRAPEAAWAQDVIDRQVSHLVRLVDDLLDVSRITRGKIRLEFEQVEVATIINNAVETSRPNIEAGGHQLEVQIPDSPIWISADQARISQVLANLLNNAAKYTPDGGLIRISAALERDEVVFRVRDNGVGIPPEMLAKVFDLFTQVDRSLDRSQGGLGIGLTLVQRLIEMHGGRVEASSAGPGQGSEFVVRLPASTAPQTHRETDQSQEAFAALGRLRILVVDDNVDAADSLAKLLRLGGHQIRIAYDGTAALEAAETFRPQAVVLDLGLPGIDGYEVARRLREDGANSATLLIALSGYGRQEDIDRSGEVGFDHHLVKPVDYEALLRILYSKSAAASEASAANL